MNTPDNVQSAGTETLRRAMNQGRQQEVADLLRMMRS